ncbi:hypothetical protein [Microbacterium azadirachtae]|uniref:Uncharacterized protein n=1 Tax=Microbacterium azadirachtae TaxID=582680 RepID=A0A0F0LFD0_9MICO|nr:hypothetical protein [Microbacterium azadirachtae]KJL31394.1 hypothetical protein RS86_03517 [Microbacterium azadirachtae]
MILHTTRTSEGLRIGPVPPAHAQAALLETAGALLVWDAADPAGPPTATVWDPALALDVAWQVYGPDAVPVLLERTGSFAPAPAPALDHARRAALATWAAAWWPASSLAGIPPLDPRILAVERADALIAVEHVLDGDELLLMALADGLTAARALRLAPGIDAAVLPALAALEARVEEAAADRGITAGSAAMPAREDFALAASATARSAADVLAEGTEPLDLSAFAPGTVDAAGSAHWQVRSAESHVVLEISVPRAPSTSAADPGPLDAVFAGVALALRPQPGHFTGSVAAPATILLTPPAARTLALASRGYRGRRDVDAGALLALARERLGRAREAEIGETGIPDQAVLLAEQEAARR